MKSVEQLLKQLESAKVKNMRRKKVILLGYTYPKWTDHKLAGVPLMTPRRAIVPASALLIELKTADKKRGYSIERIQQEVQNCWILETAKDKTAADQLSRAEPYVRATGLVKKK